MGSLKAHICALRLCMHMRATWLCCHCCWHIMYMCMPAWAAGPYAGSKPGCLPMLLQPSFLLHQEQHPAAAEPLICLVSCCCVSLLILQWCPPRAAAHGPAATTAAAPPRVVSSHPARLAAACLWDASAPNWGHTRWACVSGFVCYLLKHKHTTWDWVCGWVVWVWCFGVFMCGSTCPCVVRRWVGGWAVALVVAVGWWTSVTQVCW